MMMMMMILHADDDDNNYHDSENDDTGIKSLTVCGLFFVFHDLFPFNVLSNVPEVKAEGDRIIFVVDFQHIRYFKTWRIIF